MRYILSSLIILTSLFGELLAAEDPKALATIEESGSVERARMPLISRYYRAGSHLIYDCQDKHFACVDQSSYEKCDRWRKEAIAKMEDFMPCTPLKRFKTTQQCNRYQYEAMHRVIPKRFCIRIKKKN